MRTKKEARKKDPDIMALKGAIKALNNSSSWIMLRANFAYLKDYFLDHPSEETKKRFNDRICIRRRKIDEIE